MFMRFSGFLNLLISPFCDFFRNDFVPIAHFMLVQLYHVNMVLHCYCSIIDVKPSCYGLTIFI